jgi:hypothetical protein
VSLTLSAPGKHTAAYRDLEARLAQSEARVRKLKADKQAMARKNEQLACDLTRTILRASQDAMWRAQADEENGRLKARVKELGDKVIRGAANEARLRQAVVNARPRIREVDTQLVRPYSPVVCLPYVSPVPYRSTANDETQQLPVIELPATTQ